MARKFIQSSPEQELNDVYAPSKAGRGTEEQQEDGTPVHDAISSGLACQVMEKHDNLVLMTRILPELGGVFKITEFCGEVRQVSGSCNTPLCESAIVGITRG